MIIYLDFDGVLNNTRYRERIKWHRKPLSTIDADIGNLGLDPYNIKNMYDLFEDIDPEIVVISAWRKWADEKRLREIFKKDFPGLSKRIIGKTERLGIPRGEEVKKYGKPGVIIDDKGHWYSKNQLSCAVITSPKIGFSEKDRMKAVEVSRNI